MMFLKNRLSIIYAACFLAYLLFGTANFAYDFVTIKQEITISPSEIYTENLKQLEDTSFVSVTNDPQLIINLDLATVKPQTIKYTLSCGGTGERALYYQTDKQQEFSGKRCLLPKTKDGKTVGYILPNKDINCIRLDIGGTQGEKIEVESVVVNYKPSFFDYFDFSPMTITKLLVLPLLIGAVIEYLLEMYSFYIKRQR